MKPFHLVLILYTIFPISSCDKIKPEEKAAETAMLKKGWLHYQGPDLSFDYPKEWRLSVDTSMGEVFHISRPEETLATMVAYDISISYYESSQTFPDFVKAQARTMKELYSIQIIREEKISFDSKEANKYLAEFPTDAGDSEPAEIYFIKGAEKYYVIFNAGSKQYRTQANSIIQTMKLN